MRSQQGSPVLFVGLPWGTSGVLAATLERLRQLGWTAHQLPPVRDVDRPEDVDWLLASGLLAEAERAQLAPYLVSASAQAGPA